MNKKIILNVLIVIVIVLGLFFIAKNRTPADTTTDVSSTSPCEELNLPEGSWIFDEGGGCVPTEEHQTLVNQLWRDEYDSSDERQLAFIRNVYEKDGDIYIDADYFQWLSNSDGTCVLASENGPFEGIDPKTSIPLCNPNGFLIVNSNPQIRTFKLSPDVKIRLMEEFGNIPDLRTFSPSEFMTEKNRFGKKLYVYDGENYEDPVYLPFQLLLKNSEVLFIHQVYTP
jgi:hypothetical protein